MDIGRYLSGIDHVGLDNGILDHILISINFCMMGVATEKILVRGDWRLVGGVGALEVLAEAL